nr:MAG: hypothetical protein [Microvirus sp.]
MRTEKEKLFKIHEIENTPFNVLEKENKFKIILGNEIISPDYETLKQAENEIEKKPWWLIIATTHIVCEKIKEFKEKQEKINNLSK